jgi:hypothetical protein
MSTTIVIIAVVVTVTMLGLLGGIYLLAKRSERGIFPPR